MAVAVAKGLGADWPAHNVLNGRTAQFVAATFDDSYDAGGDALVAADVGLSRIDAVIVLGAAVAADGLTAAVVSYDHAAGKLQAWVGDADAETAAVLTEAGATDLDGLTVRLLVFGA